VQAGDGLASAELTVASGSAVIDTYEIEGGEVVAFLSGGTAGAVTTITATAETNEGETLAETIYLPIRAAGNGFSYTARDIVDFALRKIAGNGNAADSAEADDALERLNDLIADWRINGADIGVPAPYALTDTVTVADEYISALKFNLRIACHDHYGEPISAYDAQRADTTYRNIVNRLTTFGDLSSPYGLSSITETVADLF
jgi:hypothetical protein